MPPRPTWKGFLKVSLVNIPVKVFPETESAATISFNQLHGECQTRIQQKRGCALYGRGSLGAVKPPKKGLVTYTLHHDAETRSIDEIEDLNSVPSKAKPQEMKLAKQIVATFDSELNLKDY